MPGAHSYVQYSLLTNSTLTMAQDQWTLQEKKKSQSEKPAHGPPLQARVVAANRTVLTTSCDDPDAHGNEQGGGQSKMNGGKNIDVCMAWQRWQASKAGRTRPLQANTAGGRSDRHRPRSKTTASRRHWPASRRAVQVGGGSTVVLALKRRAQTYLPVCLPPTYRLCLSPSLPTPLIYKNPI